MAADSQGQITIDELFRIELQGKKVALGRYDTILWQIRSGYAVVLYAALGLLFKSGLSFDAIDCRILFLAWGFSALAYPMDLVFRIRQLRVASAHNCLADQALKHARGEPIDRNLLRELLHIAGESRWKLERSRILRAVISIFLFYSSTPILLSLLRMYSTP